MHYVNNKIKQICVLDFGLFIDAHVQSMREQTKWLNLKMMVMRAEVCGVCTQAWSLQVHTILGK